MLLNQYIVNSFVMGNKYGKFSSWNIYSNNVSVKHCDKSFFQHHGSGIPIKIRWYFNAESLNLGDKKDITLLFQKKEYKAYISRESVSTGRTRIFWYNNLSNVFNNYLKKSSEGYPSIRLEKIKNDYFSISFIDFNKINANDNDNLENTFEINHTREGKKVVRYVTQYERNSKNRYEAIKIHGTKCMACGFDFENFYGEFGANFIEVHHIKPLFKLDDEIIIDPKTDLICLCSNCHRIVHLKRDKVLSLEELKQMISVKRRNC